MRNEPQVDTNIPRRQRFRGGVAVATLIGALLGAGLLSPDTAQAQTTLIANTSQTPTSSTTVGHVGSSRWTRAQEFTTGDNDAGYTLAHVRLSVNGVDAQDQPQISIYSYASGNPGTLVHSLTNPSGVTGSGFRNFTAPANAGLAPETRYFVVVQATGSDWFGVGVTTANGENAGGASAWSIANGRRHRNHNSAWNGNDGSIRIGVFGSLKVRNATGVPKNRNRTVTTLQDTTHTFAAAEFGFIDTGYALASVTVVTLPTAGELRLDGTAIAAANLPLTVTRAKLDAGGLTFVPASGASGMPYARFTFKVNHGAGDSATAYRMTVNVTTSSETAATGAPAISGIAKVGRTLTAALGPFVRDLNGLPATAFPTGYTFQWVRVNGSTETDISGATSETYTLGTSDTDRQVRVKVSFTDRHGYSETRTSEKYPRHERRILHSGRTGLEPTVLQPESGYYSDEAMTQPLRSGTRRSPGQDIWVKVRFSRHMAVVVGNDASEARPQIYYKIGDRAPVQFRMMSYEFYTQASGECRRADPNKVADTNEFHCRYTFTGDEEGTFTFEVGTESEAAGRPPGVLYERYTHEVAASMQVEGDPPTIEGTPAIDGAGDDNRWDAGETVNVRLAFNEAVSVATAQGTPSVVIDLGVGGTEERSAAYASGTGTDTLTFAYMLVEDDGAHTLVALRPSSLATNGGTIRSVATGVDAALEHQGALEQAGGAQSRGSAGGGRSAGEAPSVPARFAELPEHHDGENTFTVALRFEGTPSLAASHEDARAAIEVGAGVLSALSARSKRADAPWELTITPDGIGDVTLRVRASACNEAGALCVNGAALGQDIEATVPGEPMTARFTAAPEAHDGSGPLEFDLEFSHAPQGLSYVTVRDALFDVSGGAITGVRRLEAGKNLRWRLTAEPSGAGEVSLDVRATSDCTATHAVCDADGRKLAGTLVHVVPALPVTARFTKAPGEHDGSSAFLLEFAFSHAPADYSYRTVHEHLFDVTNGTIEKARRLVQGSNLGWEVRVAPEGFGPVTLSARATTDCAAEHAACDAAGRRFDGSLSATVAGPPTLSVADATVEEAEGATLDFVVTLSKAVAETVTVGYATSNGSATAGSDYTETSGTLAFAANETSKTVSVPILDDAHDEGSETVGLTLSSPSPARVKLEDASAEGTITNDDQVPQAWTARFGRTVAKQAVEAVQGRFTAPRTAARSVTVAGVSIGGWTGEAGVKEAHEADAEEAAQEGEARRSAATLSEWLDPEGEHEPEARALTGRDLLTGSSFAVTGGSADAGFASIWGRGAVTRFDGREGEMTLDGEVWSAMLGADYSRDALVAGLMLSHARGEGGYRSPAGDGEVSSTLTALFPYGRIEASERLSIWGMAGYGEGTLTLTPEDAAPLRPDLSFLMGAMGVRGVLAGADGAAVLALKSDAMAARTSTAAASGSDGGGNLAASEADVTRLRLALEGSHPVRLGGSAVLTPSLELGVRHDGGDAETGFGADIGAGLALSDPARGLSGEIRARGLLIHEADGLGELGLSGTLSFDPRPGTEEGLALRLTQTMGGPSSGGADALLGRTTLAGLGAEDEGGLDARRLDARVGYGFGVLDERYTAVPELGLGLSDTGREYRLGWRLTERVSAGLAFDLGVTGTRSEPAGGGTGAEHGIAVGAGWKLVGAGTESFELRMEVARRDAANEDAEPEHSVGVRLRARW